MLNFLYIDTGPHLHVNECCVHVVQQSKPIIKYLGPTCKKTNSIIDEKWFLHSFLTTASQQADVAGNILLFFYKKKTKQNKK
jgi:hypothetical protein